MAEDRSTWAVILIEHWLNCRDRGPNEEEREEEEEDE
jgi:hypothetical protein